MWNHAKQYTSHPRECYQNISYICEIMLNIINPTHVNIARVVFIIIVPFSMVVNILSSDAFSTKRGFFLRTFLYEIILEQDKKSWKLSLTMVELYFQEFLFQGLSFFHRTFLVTNFRALFSKTFFQRTFLRRLCSSLQE